MMPIDRAGELLAIARRLPSGDDLRNYTIRDVMERCNGVGAAWMDLVRLRFGRSLTDLCNHLLSWAMPASVRHDIMYGIGGTAKRRRADDRIFLEDCLWLARELYREEPWWNPMRYARLLLRRREARKMYLLLRAFGWLAYSYDNAADRENEEWIADERAQVVDAKLLPENTEEKA